MLDFLNENLIFYFVIFAAVIVTIFEYISNLPQGNLKKGLVSSISIALIIWLDWISFCVLTICATGVLAVVKAQLNIRKNLVWIVVFSIGFLVLAKDYQHFFSLDTVYVPLGISYYFFRLISLLIDYSKNPDDYKNIDIFTYYHYIFFFPLFLAGPIHRFVNFKELPYEEMQQKKPFWYRNLIIALVIKFFLVDLVFRSLSVYYKETMIGTPDLTNIIVFGFIAFFHSYMDLLAYTEIANRISNILGFTHQENFNEPLLATNISMFWQRWHMSLSNWTRDYVFFPTLLKTRSTWLATYCSMLVIGIWHSSTGSWIFWAFCHATAINLYGEWRKTKIYKKTISNEFGKILSMALGILITNIFVYFVFVFVALQDFRMTIGLFLQALGMR